MTRAASEVSWMPVRIPATLVMALPPSFSPSEAIRLLPSDASLAAWVASRISVMRFLISLVDSMTFSASRRISAATMEKPRPASPAFAPSRAALRARRSERSAISSMTSTTVPIRSTRFESFAMASSTSVALWRTFSIEPMNALIAPSPVFAPESVCSAMAATIWAFSAIWWEAPFSSSIVAVVSWIADACADVDDSFWVAAASTSADEVESWSAASRISVTNFFSVSITWPTPAMSGVSAASETPRRSEPERSPWITRRTIAAIASSTPAETVSMRSRASRISASTWSAVAFTALATSWNGVPSNLATSTRPPYCPTENARSTATMSSAGGPPLFFPAVRGGFRFRSWGSGMVRPLSSGALRGGAGVLAHQGGQVDEEDGRLVHDDEAGDRPGGEAGRGEGGERVELGLGDGADAEHLVDDERPLLAALVDLDDDAALAGERHAERAADDELARRHVADARDADGVEDDAREHARADLEHQDL